MQLVQEKYEGSVLSFLRSCHNSAAPSPHLSIKILNNSRRNCSVSRLIVANKQMSSFSLQISCIPTPQRLVSKENLILDCYMEESFPLFLQSATPCTKPYTQIHQLFKSIIITLLPLTFIVFSWFASLPLSKTKTQFLAHVQDSTVSWLIRISSIYDG